MPPTITTLEERCLFINGGAWSQTEYVDDGIPVVQVTNLQNGRVSREKQKFLPPSSLGKYAKHQLQTYDLVIATVGSHPTQPGSVVGRASIIPEYASGALLNQNAVCIRPIDDILDKRYLGYLGQSSQMRNYIVSVARGAANQVRLAIGSLKKFKFELPTIYEQRRIARILSAYDDLIDNNNRRIALLEEAIHRLYREWFVHLRFPGHEHTPLVAGVPQGWENASLKQLFPKIETVKTGPFGSKLHAHDYRDAGVPLILVKHIKNGFVDDTDIPLVGEHKWAELKTYRLKPQDIVVSRVGYVGAAAYIHSIHDGWFFSGQTLRVRLPENEKLHPRFLAQFYQTHYFTKMIESMATGSTRLSLNTKILASFAIPVPNYSQQLEFVQFAQPIDKMILNLRQQNGQLSKARDALLPRLMNGSLAL